MSLCYNITSNGRFINEIGKTYEGEVTAASFSQNDEGKTLVEYLFDAISGYANSSVNLSNAISTYHKLVDSIMEVNPRDFWSMGSQSGVAHCNCRNCGACLDYSYSYMTASFNSSGTYRLSERQEKVRRVKLTMPPAFFRRDVMRVRCAQFVQSFLENMPGREAMAPGFSLAETRDPAVVDGNMQIRSLFKYLLERREETAGWSGATDTMAIYAGDLGEWLLYSGTTLMRRASYSDHLFMLTQLVAATAPSGWGGVSLIQFPRDASGWTPSLVDHYFQMLHVAVGLGTMPGEMFTNDSIRKAFTSVAAFGEFDEGGEDTNFAICDKDLKKVLLQLRIAPLFSYILGVSLPPAQQAAADRGRMGTPKELPFARSMFLRLLLLVRIACKGAMRLRRKKSVKTLLKFAAIVVNKLADMCMHGNGVLTWLCGRVPVENAVLVMAYAIVHSGVPKAWDFIRLLPLQVLSERSSWGLFSVLHMLPAASIKYTEKEWLAYIRPAGAAAFASGRAKDPYLDEFTDDDSGSSSSGTDINSSLVAKLVEAAGGAAESVRDAVVTIGNLAEGWDGALTRACMHSLFRVVFHCGVEDEKVSEFVTNFLSAMCSKDIGLVKDIVGLLPVGFAAGKIKSSSLYLELVERVPFGDWDPEPEYARTVAWWTNASIGTPKHDTGKQIMDSVQWPKISIGANRAVAYALTRAAIAQRARHGNESFFRKMTGHSDFKKYRIWTSNILGALAYYVVGSVVVAPTTGVVAKDIEVVERDARSLIKKLHDAEETETFDSVLKKVNPEELFALFMLSSFGTDEKVWTEESPFVMKLLKALIEAPDVDEFKTPVLCQLVPYVFANVEDKEALKERVIPDYSSIVRKYVEKKGHISLVKKLKPEKVNRVCYQLISAQIDTYPLDIARSFGDFWLKIATYHKKWFSDIPSAAILSVFLQSWFALKEGELPLPEYEQTIAGHIKDWVTTKSVSMIPIKARKLIIVSPLPQFPYVLFETLYYETKYLFDRKSLCGDALAKKARQWSLYTIELPNDCELGLLFWQMTTYLYSRAVADKKASSSALKPLFRDKDRKRIVDKLQELKSATDYPEISEFYSALREYFWVSVQDAKGPGVADLNKAASDDKRNWMLVTALHSSPLEYPKTLMLPYVPRAEIARDIRSTLVYEERHTEKRRLEYSHVTFDAVLGKCPVGQPKDFPEVASKECEAVWDANSQDRDALLIARDPDVGGIYSAVDNVLSKDLSVDSAIRANDSDYEHLIRGLYVRQTRNDNMEVRCNYCNAGYGIATYSYTESVLDQGVMSRATYNREKALEYYRNITMVGAGTITKVVLLDDTAHKIALTYDLIVRKADEAGPTAPAAIPPELAAFADGLFKDVLRGIGLTCVDVFFLTNMLNRIVYDLTRAFIRVNYDSAVGLLDLVLTDRVKGERIAPFFAPWVVRSGFVELLRKMLGAYTQGNSIHEFVLKNFNIGEWARLGRSVEEKTAAATEIAAVFPRCRADKFLCDYVVASFEGVIHEGFPELLFPVLGLFMHHPDCPAHLLWAALARQDASLVSAAQARDTLIYIATNLGNYRAAKDFHFKFWSPSFPEFVNGLIVHHARAAAAAGNEDIPRAFFAEALNILAPCLDAVSANSPWGYEDVQKEAILITAFSNGLAALVRKLVDAAPKLGAHFVSETWRYVTQTLKTLRPGNMSCDIPKPFVQDTMLNSLATVPWGAWLPPRDVFKDVVSMSCENLEAYAKVPSFSRFMVSFGTAITWREADYYSADTLLELHSALTRSLALYPEPVEKPVYDQVYRLSPGTSDRVEWDLLSTEMLKPVMDESVQLLIKAPRHKDELFKWFVLYVYIAQTCGIKIISPEMTSDAAYCKDDEYYANVLTSENFAAFVDYFVTLQQQDESICPGMPTGPADAILCAFKGFFDGSAGTLESVGAAVSRFFCLYNRGTKNTDIHPAVMYFLRRYPECACLFSQYLCYCVTESPRLLPYLEDYLGCYFGKFDDWGAVSRHVSIPATTTPQLFIEEALTKSYYLSFFAAFRLVCNSGWDVLNLDLYKLIDKVTVIPGRERGFFLFCYALLRQTCLRLSAQPTARVLFAEQAQLQNLEEFLTTIAQDKARDGFLGKIGLGKKSELDTVFRVCAKTLAAFIKAQFVEVDKKKKIATLRIMENDPFSLKENLALYKDVSFKKYIKQLGDSYIARVSEYFYDIMSNPEITILSYSRLLASIAECVYQGRAYEFSCFRDDIEVELDVKGAVTAIVEEMRKCDRSDEDAALIVRTDCEHLGRLGSTGFSQRAVFDLGGTDLVISLICDPEFQKEKEDIQAALTALWELVLGDFDIQLHAIFKEVVPAILAIADSTSSAAEAAYRLLSALLVDDDLYKKIITDEIIAKAADTKSTKVFAAALARTEDEEVVELRSKETCSGARALRCTEKKCLDKKVFFCPHCNVQQHFYVCITCSKEQAHTVQFCEVCWAACHKQENHEFKKIFAVGKCSCKNFTCKASVITSPVEFKHMDPPLVAQWVRSACHFDEATAEIFRQKNVSGKKLLSMSKSDMTSVGLNVDQIATLRAALAPYKSFFNRAASLFTRDYSYIDTLYGGECDFSFPEMYSHPSTLSEALTAAQDVLPPAVQVDAIYNQCLNLLKAMKNDPDRNWFIKEFSLTDDEVMAVLMYTYDITVEDAESATAQNGDCFSVQFNRLLRQYTPTMQNSLSGYMYFTIAALKKIPPYSGIYAIQERNAEDDCGVYVYRGVPNFSGIPNFEEVYAQGKEVTWPSFSSVSANIDESRRAACSGADPSLRLLFIIRVKKSARDIHCISAFSSDSEVLIAPGTVFRVVSSMEWSDPESVNRIELEEVSTKFF